MTLPKTAILVLASLLLTPFASKADPGDTTWVQTYTWEAQNNPATAYDNPGRRWFQFPSQQDTAYRKVLMIHRLKCFEDGTAGNLGFPCGEWDYLTYNYLFDHTGLFDSTALFHPTHLLNDADFDQASLVLDPEGGAPADTLIRLLATVSHEFDQGSALWTSLVDGPADASMVLEGQTRHQWLWSAAELNDLGWMPGDSAWRMSLPRAGNLAASEVARLTLRARWTSVEALSGMVTSGWTTLVDGPVSVGDMAGSWDLDFLQPLVREPGMNLLLDVALDGVTMGEGTGLDVQAFNVADSLTQFCEPSSMGAARYVRMDGNDRMEIDTEALLGLDTTVTVECWLRGDAATLPTNTTLFEGVNAANQREINVHVPWGNSAVYWDCGFDGGYDRIEQGAGEGILEGNWVHWAFTKDAQTGIMNIYVNGQLWLSGNGKDNVMAEVVRMNLGGSAYGDVDYFGDVAAFRMWDEALTVETVAAWMHRTSESSLAGHPQADHLLGAMNMQGMDGEVTQQGELAGWMHGDAGRRAFTPREAFLDAASGDERPALVLEGGALPLTAIGDSFWAEAQPVPPMSITEWDVFGNDVAWTDLQYGWPADLVTATVTEWGDTLSTHVLEGPVVDYNNEELAYWSEPFEVIDRYELSRYITPYGINLTLDSDGWAWVFDVTDYLPLLKDSVELQCGNWQELLDLKFAFIEGTAPRDVKNVTAFWKGIHYLNNWDATILPETYTPGEGEAMWRLKTRASGHDFGQGNNCAEFCYNTHSVKVNGVEQWSWEIMQECADNPLFPQGGTWIYDRAGWCPGAPVRTEDLELTPLVAGQESFDVEYDVTYDPHGNYRMEGQIIGYGPANMAHDVEVMDILAPSDDKLLSRLNPVCEHPVVRIRNNGSEPLTAVTFVCGIVGGELVTQTLTLETPMAFLETRDVEVLYDMAAYVQGDDEELLRFEVRADVPDGMDEEPTNGWMSTTFRRPPTWQYNDLDDNRIIVWTKTNNVPGETTVEIARPDGTVQWARAYSEPNTTYRDTIELNQGCYRFNVYDSDDDGIDFWANNDGAGYVRLKKVAGGNFKVFESDFGKSISQAFYFATNLVSEVGETQAFEGDLVAFPNPLKDQITLLPAGLTGQANWQVFSVQGQLLDSGTWWAETGQPQSLDATEWPTGSLVVVVRQGDRHWIKWLVKE